MSDPTESIRREMVAEINSAESDREQLELQHGQVWDTDEMQADFTVVGFMAPYIVAKRKSDGVKGSLVFQHDPRLYYNFKED